MNSYIEISLRSVAVYVVILALMRLGGKRSMSQLSLADFVLVLLVANAVQNSMVGSDTSLVGGLIAAITLILLNVILGRIAFLSPAFGRLIEGEPTLLIWQGAIVESNLRRESIRPVELEAALHEHGLECIDQVRQAILEVDGSISVISSDGRVDQTIPAGIVRRRHSGHRGMARNG